VKNSPGDAEKLLKLIFGFFEFKNNFQETFASTASLWFSFSLLHHSSFENEFSFKSKSKQIWEELRA